MPDRGKVITGLECCMSEKICSSKCPYKGQCDDGGYYYSKAIADALSLLKEQEPRVMTFEEVQQADAGTVVWFEQHTLELDYINPMVSTGDGCVGNNFLGVCLQYMTNEGRGFRFWSARPTDEQRKATPWELPKEGLTVKDDLISREAAIEYLMTNMGWCDEDGYQIDDADEKRTHIENLMNGIPSVPAVPLDKLCEWLSEEGIRIPCKFCPDFVCDRCTVITSCPSTADDWRRAIQKMMEG